MKRLIQFWSATTVGNCILAPIGFMTPGAHLAGFFSASLALASFTILVFIYEVDRRTRAEFIKVLSRFRLAAPNDEGIQQAIDKIEAKIMDKGTLVSISSDIGYLNGHLVQRGVLHPEDIHSPEVDL